MNMNKEMINRALYAAGRKTLVEIVDAVEYEKIYSLCKTSYLSTFLEALSEVSWTSGRKRKPLLRARVPHAPTGYRFVYHLPLDCARPIELLDKGWFVIEGEYLCTDVEAAELLYVTDGKTFPEISIAAAPKPWEWDEDFFIINAGDADESDIPIDHTFYPGTVEELQDTIPGDPVVNEDYPEYRPPAYEPKFYEYVEKMLAAKFAMTENPRVHTELLQEALLIKKDAIASTRSTAAAKHQPETWWSDRLGLGGV
jgi:hypothetical protein